MRKYKKAAGLLAVSLVISMCSGCVMDREKSSESQAGETANLTDEDAEIKKAAKQDINEVHLRDKDTLYENDDETSVVTMYLTVFERKCIGEYRSFLEGNQQLFGI